MTWWVKVLFKVTEILTYLQVILTKALIAVLGKKQNKSIYFRETMKQRLSKEKEWVLFLSISPCKNCYSTSFLDFKFLFVNRSSEFLLHILLI